MEDIFGVMFPDGIKENVYISGSATAATTEQP